MTTENREGFTPASGHQAKVLDEMLEMTKELRKVIKLERSGVRDGDGYWHGSDALGGTIENMGKTCQRFMREADAAMQHELGGDICSDCGAHMQATHHPLCQGQDGIKDEENIVGTVVWIDRDGQTATYTDVQRASLCFTAKGTSTLGDPFTVDMQNGDPIPF